MHDPRTYDVANGHGSGALMGFVLGAAVGAGLALLMAPASGSETRRRLGETSRRLGHTVKDGVDYARQHLGKAKQEASERIGEIKDDVQSAVASGREAFAKEMRSSGNPGGR